MTENSPPARAKFTYEVPIVVPFTSDGVFDEGFVGDGDIGNDKGGTNKRRRGISRDGVQLWSNMKSGSRLQFGKR